MTSAEQRPLQLGLRAKLGQFVLLVAVNALVGGMVGQERTVLPLLADEAFGVRAASAALTFIVVFGLVKAATNLLAGALSDRFGRKPVLVAGWVIGLPVPLLIIWAPGWEWVVIANAPPGVTIFRTPSAGMPHSAPKASKLMLPRAERSTSSTTRSTAGDGPFALDGPAFSWPSPGRCLDAGGRARPRATKATVAAASARSCRSCSW